MSPILIDYYNRFAKGNSYKFDYFFSQLAPQQIKDKLPYLFGIEVFCLRLLQALVNQEKICIYSDYDTDAVTATATMYWGLVELGFDPQKISFYAPDRFIEGYGMNLEASKKLAVENDLIITVDCGINSTQEADLIMNSGCDLLITDHHHLHGDLPKALAVINPRLSDFFTQKPNQLKSPDTFWRRFESKLDSSILEFYRTWSRQVFHNKDKRHGQFLSHSVTGVGVAWFCVVWLAYFLQAIQENSSIIKFSKQLNQVLSKKIIVQKLNHLLGFVAIGTMADCQSILDTTNRLLVRTGIQILQENKHSYLGLKSLLLQTGLQDKINQGYKLNSQDLAFVFAPILNSSGRISHANLSIQLLLADSLEKADLLASELIATNEERKNMVKQISAVLAQNVSTQIAQNYSCIWLEGDWNKGIIGLLASKFVTQFALPCIVVSIESDQAVASLRAPEGFHLPEAMKQASQWLTKFGGHPGAAGFTCNTVDLPKVKEILQQVLAHQAQNLTKPNQVFVPDNFTVPPQLQVLSTNPSYIWLTVNDLNTDLLQKVWNLDPFGQDFPIPKFVFNLESYSLRWLGQEGRHIRINLKPEISVTIFNLDEQIKQQFLQINLPKNIWLEAKLTQNTWNGNTRNDLVAERVWVL